MQLHSEINDNILCLMGGNTYMSNISNYYFLSFFFLWTFALFKLYKSKIQPTMKILSSIYTFFCGAKNDNHCCLNANILRNIFFCGLQKMRMHK